MATKNSVLDRLWEELATRSYQGRIVSVEHLGDLKEGIEIHRREGLLDEEFYRIRLTGFHFTPPETLPEARSIIVVAVPRPQTQAVFHWGGESLSLILPPTYTRYNEIAREVARLVGGVLALSGYGVAQSQLPFKLLVQAERAFENLQSALAAAGATYADVVKVNIYVKHYNPTHAPVVREAMRRVFHQKDLPASTWLGVETLALEGFLIEVDAVAVVET